MLPGMCHVIDSLHIVKAAASIAFDAGFSTCDAALNNMHYRPLEQHAEAWAPLLQMPSRRRLRLSSRWRDHSTTRLWSLMPEQITCMADS